MKILFLTSKFYPSIGGVEKHVLEISKRLIERGHEVVVISEGFPKSTLNKGSNYHSVAQSDTYSIKNRQAVKSSQIEQFVYGKIKIFRLNFGENGWFKKFRIWFGMLRMIRLVRNADIVHCHDIFFWYLPFKFLMPFKEVYTTFHGYESYPIKIKAVLVRKLSEFLSNGTICVGEFMKKWYKADPDFVIYGGVDLKSKISFDPELRTEGKNQKSKKHLGALFVGRLDEQTNIVEYCRAVKKIREKIPGFKFVIAGDGRFRKYAEKYGRVLGFVENPEEKLQNYQFAFVSRYLSILEALAAKRAVFALYDNPLKEDYLKMSPFARYINIFNNPSDLASIVQFYCTNKKIEQKQLETAYEWAKKQTWDQVVSVYLRLWNR